MTNANNRPNVFAIMSDVMFKSGLEWMMVRCKRSPRNANVDLGGGSARCEETMLRAALCSPGMDGGCSAVGGRVLAGWRVAGAPRNLDTAEQACNIGSWKVETDGHKLTLVRLAWAIWDPVLKERRSRAWWRTPVIPALGRQRQMDL